MNDEPVVEALAAEAADAMLGLTAWRAALRRELRTIWRALEQSVGADLQPIEHPAGRQRPGVDRDREVAISDTFNGELGGQPPGHHNGT